MTDIQRRDFVRGATTAMIATPFIHTASHAADCAKIKVGQIGVQHAHASGKMATMRKYRDLYDVVGVVEPDEQRRKQAENSGTYKDLKWMTAEQLLNVKGLQAVAVETQVKDLLSTGKACVDAGLHIHLDKPAGTSLSEFAALLKAATANKRTVQMGYMLRYNPAFQFMFNALKEGWLGELFEVHTVMSKVVGAGARKHIAEFSGGSMFELGCHIIDATVKVLGKPTKVHAHLRRTKPEQDTLADNCLAVLEYPKATATVRSSLLEIEGGRRRQFVACGTEGSVDIRPLEPARLQLALSKARGTFKRGYQEVNLPKSPGRYDGEFIDLAKIIRGEKEADFTPEHDLAVHETVLRASGMAVE